MKKIIVTRISEAHDGFDASYAVELGDAIKEREIIAWNDGGKVYHDPYLDGYRKAVLDIALKEVEVYLEI
jgi:hypothetical protein